MISPISLIAGSRFEFANDLPVMLAEWYYGLLTGQTPLPYTSSLLHNKSRLL